MSEERPDFRELVGDGLTPEEELELARVDGLLRSVPGPATEVPGSLTRAVERIGTTTPIWTRRRLVAAVALAATLAALFFGVGRWVDRVGPWRTFAPSIVILSIGLALIPITGTRAGVVAGAVLYGLGFSSVGPAFTTYVISRVSDSRRGSAFGANLAAYDSGIGLGSILFGLIVAEHGFAAAFVGAVMVIAGRMSKGSTRTPTTKP